MEHFFAVDNDTFVQNALSMQNRVKQRVFLSPRGAISSARRGSYNRVREFCFPGAGASFSSPGFAAPTVSPLLFPASSAREITLSFSWRINSRTTAEVGRKLSFYNHPIITKKHEFLKFLFIAIFFFFANSRSSYANAVALSDFVR